MESQYLDVFGKITRDESITNFEYVEYRPRDADMDKSTQIIETRDLDEYLLPHKAMLEIRGRLVKTVDGTAFAPEDEITLVNNGWSLFKTVEYQVNNHTVESIEQYVPTTSTIMNLAQFSDDYGRSTATNMLWYRDTGGGVASGNEFLPADEIIPVGDVGNAANVTGADFRDHFSIARNAGYNSGFRSRQLVTTGAKDVCMYMPLSSLLGFCKDIDTVFFGVKHGLLLTRESPENYIHRANGVAPGKFVIKHLSLWVPKITPSLEITSKIEQKLVKGHLRDLYFEQSRIYRRQYGSTDTSPSWRITTNSNEELPTHVFCCIQAAPRDGDQEQNNQVFDNGNLRSISLHVNSERFPERELETDFRATSRNYGRAYMMFQEAVQKYADVDSGSQVSVEDFASLYPIFHFDVSRHKEKLRNSPADIELKWRLGSRFEYPAGTAADYNVYALVLSERFLKLEAMSGKMNVVV